MLRYSTVSAMLRDLQTCNPFYSMKSISCHDPVVRFLFFLSSFFKFVRKKPFYDTQTMRTENKQASCCPPNNKTVSLQAPMSGVICLRLSCFAWSSSITWKLCCLKCLLFSVHQVGVLGTLHNTPMCVKLHHNRWRKGDSMMVLLSLCRGM